MYIDSIPLFSVIIPCYNVVEWIGRAFHSLEKQTFRNFEVVLVDDYSTDRTYDLLLNYRISSVLSVQVLRNGKNRGPGASRNYGIREARGEYVAFLDSDDWYEPDYLEQMYQTIRQTKAEIVFCDFFRCLETGKKVWIRNTALYTTETDRRQYIALCFDSLCVSVIRKKLFEKIVLPDLYNAEDSVTIPLLLAQSNKVSFFKKPLYNYLCRKNSLSTSKGLRVIKDVCAAYRYLQACLPKEYAKEMEFRGIRMIVYGVVFKALQARMSIRQLNDIIEEFKQNHKCWYNNDYLRYLPWRKRMFLKCVRWKMYSLLRLYVQLQEYLLKV